jgi:hypothetical protein
MSTRSVISVVINLVAIVAPTAALYASFGRDTHVATSGPEATGHLIALVGTTSAAFLAGILSSRLLAAARDETGGHAALLTQLLRPVTGEPQRHRR